MNWYLVVKYLHITAVAITIGGMFSRQLVRSIALKSDDIKSVVSLTHAAVRMDRMMVIPGSNLMILMGILLAVMQKWPIFGFLQGADRNWLLVSNLLLIVMIVLIPGVFIPHNKKVESLLQPALAEGRVTPELGAVLNDRRNILAHRAEEAIVLVVAALMVLKPF
jgi:uncharacterized membrane protein